MPDSIETLLVVAAESEATAACSLFELTLPKDAQPGTLFRISSSVWVLLTGIGKANASAMVARTLAMSPPKRVINIGIAGALPEGGLEIGDVITASRSIFADEGVDTPNGFLDCRAIGFPIYRNDDGAGLPPDQELRAKLKRLNLTEVGVATVSTCSGRDALATRIRRRTGAAAEAMEGAAVLLACQHACVPAAELRVISNTTGDRDAQVWDIGLALDTLAKVALQISDIDFD
jgi:futalosine hydrolase